MSSRRAPCPACNRGPRDTALSITTDELGTVSFCHRCGYTNWEGRERRPEAPPPKRATEPSDWSETAERIWNMTRPLGELARRYLEQRGCLLPPADGDLRYLLPTDRYPPTLCARVTDAVTGARISLHLTPLAVDGAGHGERRLLAGHRKRGGVIRLWPDEAVSYGLGIAEGIETALAAAQIYTPMWAAIDAGNLAALPVLVGVDCLAIYADHDDAGIRAAQACAHRWEAADREVCLYRPRTPGEDFADIARRHDLRRAA